MITNILKAIGFFAVFIGLVACQEAATTAAELPPTEMAVPLDNSAVEDKTTTIAPAVFTIPTLDTWVRYENPTLRFALRHPADWTVTGRGNGITLNAPQMVTIEAEPTPWSVWVSVREKFAEDASLFDVIVNDYHFEGVIEQFKQTLTEETVNGQMVYRSTIIQAAFGGQLSVFFEDGDRFVEVMLRPFNAERPYENQEAFAELFTILLESVEFTEELAEALADPAEHLSFSQPFLLLADYPPSNTPYRIDQGDFWLVHTPEGQLMAFSPVSPEYAGRIGAYRSKLDPDG